MDKKYSELVEILSISPLDILEATANVLIKVKGIELECFVPDYKVTSNFSAGEKCEVILSLLLWPNSFRLNDRNKMIENIKITRIPHCKLSGVIIDTSPLYELNHDSIRPRDLKRVEEQERIVVDCGIFIELNTPVEFRLHTGDYIKAEGRLDIEKVKNSQTFETGISDD